MARIEHAHVFEDPVEAADVSLRERPPCFVERLGFLGVRGAEELALGVEPAPVSAIERPDALEATLAEPDPPALLALGEELAQTLLREPAHAVGQCQGFTAGATVRAPRAPLPANLRGSLPAAFCPLPFGALFGRSFFGAVTRHRLVFLERRVGIAQWWPRIGRRRPASRAVREKLLMQVSHPAAPSEGYLVCSSALIRSASA